MVMAEVAANATLKAALIHQTLPICFSWPERRRISAISRSSSSSSSSSVSRTTTTRRALSFFVLTTSFSGLTQFSIDPLTCWSQPAGKQDFVELPNSGGVKALDLRVGDGDSPVNGDKVAIHYYGRMAAKQGWRFDSTYDHKDTTGEPIPFEFILGSGKFFDRQRLFTTISIQLVLPMEKVQHWEHLYLISN